MFVADARGTSHLSDALHTIPVLSEDPFHRKKTSFLSKKRLCSAKIKKPSPQSDEGVRMYPLKCQGF